MQGVLQKVLLQIRPPCRQHCSKRCAACSTQGRESRHGKNAILSVKDKGDYCRPWEFTVACHVSTACQHAVNQLTTTEILGLKAWAY